MLGGVDALESALRRVGIEPAERVLCGWAGLCLALLGATAYALLNSSETLFLKRVGVAHLPWALLGSSALLVVTTGLASRVLAEADRPRWLPRILLALAVLLLADLDPEKPATTRMAAVAVLMAGWWITEAIPISATALLPIALFPLLGILPGKQTASVYFNSIIFLFIGGFLFAIAMERWNLHRRIALRIICKM